MNTEALFVFLILLMGLMLCSFLGEEYGYEYESFTTTTSNNNNMVSTGYDNYNHYTGNSSPLISGNIFYGPNGTTATVIANSDGSLSLLIVSSSTSAATPVTFKSVTATTFNGPNNSTATIVQGKNGQKAIKVTTSLGVQYYNTNTSATNPTLTNTSTQYYGSTGQPQIAIANNGSNVYNSSLPLGIPRSAIPQGNEDLYILKSEIVPPVCPMCPVAQPYPRQEKCPPCPACDRCPEPSFECKKVPNYSATDTGFLPNAVLPAYSQFGM